MEAIEDEPFTGFFTWTRCTSEWVAFFAITYELMNISRTRNLYDMLIPLTYILATGSPIF